MRNSSKFAFTLIEIVITVFIIGLVATLAISSGMSWYNREMDNEATNKARIIDIHKGRYLTENGGAAMIAWAAATTDEERYLLIRNMIPSAPTLLGDGTQRGNFAPKNYRFTLNSLGEPTTVTKLNSGTVVYPGSGGGTNFTVTVSSGDTTMGTSVGGGAFASGETVTIYAQPFAGYRFKNWRKGATVVSSDASFTFVVSEEVILTADFELAPAGSQNLTVSRNSNFAGTVSPNSGGFTAGSSVNLVASPNSGYAFDTWTGDIGGADPASSSISVVMDQDRIVQANFVRTTITLSLNANDASWGAVSGAGSYPTGTAVNIVATAYPGFRFVRWLDGVTPLTTSATYTLTVNATTSLTAEFALEPTTGVIAGTYGSADKVGTFSVDDQGRLVSATETAIEIPKEKVTGLGTMAEQSASAVAITGGNISGVSLGSTSFSGVSITGSAIDASPIGLTSPEEAKFTFVEVASGPLRLTGDGYVSGYGGVELVNSDGFGLRAAALNYELRSADNSASRLFINDTGQIGLGGAPTVGFGKLQVLGGHVQVDSNFGYSIMDDAAYPRYVLKRGGAGALGGTNDLMLTNRALNGDTIIGANGGSAGSEVASMWIKSATGRVGIGTSNPSSLLHVAGDMKTDGTMRVATLAPDTIEVNAYGSGNRYAFVDLHGDDTYTDFGLRMIRGNGGPNAESGLSHRGTGPLKISALDAGTVAIQTGSVDRIIVDSSGNVGIGAASQGEKLDLSGNVRIRGSVKADMLESTAVGANSGITGDRPYTWGYQEGGAWTHPYPDLIIGFHTGIKFGAASGYGGVRFYNDHPSRSSTQILSVGDGDNHVRVANNLYVNGLLVLANQGPGSGLDADKVDGFDTAVPAYGNTIAVRDPSGHLYGNYGFFSYLNMSHGPSGSTGDTVFYSSSDDYIRKNNATGFRASLNVPTRTGGDASGTWPISISGNVPWGNVTGKPSQGDWSGKNSFVSEMMSWKNYGNGHVIYDGSQGTAPSGSAKNNVNPEVEWQASYPTLLGFNGYTTYGVRVDTSRYAEQAKDNFYFRNYGQGLIGVYSDTRYQGVFSMGPSWKLPDDGTSPGNLYGLAWTHQNIGGQSKSGLGHQLLVMENGITQSAIGNGIWTRAALTVGVDQWHRTTDGLERVYYSNGGRTYHRSYDGFQFRNNGGADIVFFDNSGNVRASSFNATSARRFKENITSLDSEDIHSRVLKLRPVSYVWKKGEGKGGPDLGFIAEEINDVFPEVVTKDDDGQAAGVDYGRLTAVLTSSIKTLSSENANLKARLEENEARIDRLENRPSGFSIGLILGALAAGIAGGAAVTFVLVHGRKL